MSSQCAPQADVVTLPHAAEDVGRPPVPGWVPPLSMLVTDGVVGAGLLLALGPRDRGAFVALAALLLGALVSRRVADVRLAAASGLLDELPRIAALAAVAAFAGAVGAGSPGWPGPAVLQVAVLLGAAALAGQLATRHLLRSLVAPERLLLVGHPDDRERFERQLRASGVRHLRPAGGVAVGELGRGDGGPPTLEALIEDLQIDRVAVFPSCDADREAQVARRARNAGARVMVAPRTMAAIGERVRTERIGTEVVVTTDPSHMTPGPRAMKRALDVVGALAGLVVLAGPLLAIALAVRLTSPGPVLFWQDRVGLGGRRFRIAKFRTMVADAEALKDALRAEGQADGDLFKLADDPRVTRVGRVLRRTSLDELPQLLNVLRGDMSLVGPRPLVGDEDVLVEGWYRDRLRLKPGMTGAWQVLGSAQRLPLPEMVALDHQYVAGWSLWLDVRILLRTVAFVVRRRGV